MLRPIPPQQLWDEWEWVRHGLLECIAKTGERYLPEDVYHALRSGTSHLFALDDFGFVVLQQRHEPDGCVLFVWALWSEPGKARAVEDAVYAALEGKAREIGAVRIRMHSPRKAWARERYWKPVSVVYEHEIGAAP